MRGSLADISLADLIQVTCMENRRARLVVRHGDHETAVFFDGGEVVHAENGATAGREALLDLFLVPEGEFELVKQETSPARTIGEPWSGLVLEGTLRLDEARLRQQTVGTSARSSPVADPPPGAVRALLSVPGVAGALVVAADGTVLAHQVDEDPERLAAVAIFVTGAAERLGRQLAFHHFRRGVVTLPGRRYLVLGQPDGSCLGVLLDDGVAADLVRPAVERALAGAAGRQPEPVGSRPAALRGAP